MAGTIDLATLGLEIRSDGVVVAANRLRDFENASQKSQTATAKLAQQLTGLGAALKQALRPALSLVAAYTSLRSAIGFIKTGLDFNSSLESSRIGFASLITSMVKLEDAQGNVLQGMDKYIAAQGLAAEMMERIQILGLKTTATTQELVEGVQSIIGPALQAGIALKEIPDFAVQGAQAMQTLGIPLNQMRTELDALLSGNVNKTQDILAPKLFADINDDLGEYIRGLQQSGTLIDEIKRRLKPFELAGDDVAETWTGLVSNLEEAKETLAGLSGQRFAESMKESVKTISELLLTTDENAVGISEDFKGIAEVLTEIENIIGSGILSVVRSVASGVKSVGQYINETGVDNFFSNIAQGAKVAVAALAALILYRKQAMATFTVGSGAEAQQVTGLKAYIAAQREAMRVAYERAQAELTLAKFEERRAQAELRNLQASIQAATANMSAGQAERYRAAMLTALQAKEEALAASIAKRAAAQKAADAATLTGSIKNSAIAGLSSMFGGPWGIAITAAAAGMALLATRTDETAKAAELLTRAEKSYSEAMKVATDETGKLNENLTKAQRLKLDLAKIDISTSMNAEFEKLDAMYRRLDSLTQESVAMNWYDSVSSGFEVKDIIPRDYVDQLRKLTSDLKSTKISAEEFGEAIASLREKAIQAGYGNSEFVKTLEEMSRQDGVISILAGLIAKLAGVEQASRGAASGVRALKGEVGGIGAVLDEAIKKSSLDAYVSGLGKRQQALAKGLASDLKLGEQEIKTVLSGGTVQGLDSGKLKTYLDNLGKIHDASERARGGGGGGGGTSKIDDAREKWAELENQLAVLEGRASSAAASLDKTLTSIDKTGQAAGKSAQEIQAFKEKFIQANDAKTIKELNKELLELEGNTRAVQDLENQDRADAFKARLADIRGLSQEEKDILLGRFSEAQNTSRKINDLKSGVDFLKELAALSGQYGASLEAQNALLEYQAEMYRQNLPASMQDYVDEWERLQRLQNDQSVWAGLERGVRKFGAEYGDVAAQVESFTMQMGTSISSTLADAFMKGKFSAQDFFQSLIGMAAQAASNAFIGMIFNGISGMFSAGVTKQTVGPSQGGFTTSNVVVAKYNYLAKGGMVSGGNISDFSGGIVNSPTAFSYGNISKFATGAGLMGEAGPEAILPLTRARNGDLGVRAMYDNDSYRIIAQLQDQMYRQAIQGSSSAPPVNINIINESNAQVQAGQMRQDGNGGFTVDILVSQVEQTMVNRAKQGKSQLMDYQRQTYGLDRARVLARGRGRN